MKKSQPKLKKNITLDDLAIMVAKGFEAVDKRFEQMENRFTQHDKRFESIDKRFDKVDERLDGIEFRLSKIESNHERRIDKIEDKLAILYTAFEKQLKIKLPK